MTSLLIPSAVALLAHKRLVDAVEALERKVSDGRSSTSAPSPAPAPVAVNAAPSGGCSALAQAAQAMFEGGPKADC